MDETTTDLTALTVDLLSAFVANNKALLQKLPDCRSRSFELEAERA